MRVLHFKRTLNPEEGGVVTAVLDLCSVTTAPDTEITLAAVVVPEAVRHGVERPYGLACLPAPERPGDYLDDRQLAEMRGLIKRNDVVHIHAMWSKANIQVARLCREAGVPYILSVHGMLDDWCMSQGRAKKILFLKTFSRSMIRGAAAVHCTADAELRQASAWFPRGRGVVSPLPLALDMYRDLPDSSEHRTAFPFIDPDVPMVLFLSRLHPKKGPDRLIRASAELHRSGVRHQLVIAGTGEKAYESELERLAADLGTSSFVRFAGFVTGRTKVALLAAADVFALPTHQENFGFVYFEAMAAGTPVLTTKGADTWPELERSGGGIIADNTPSAFAEALRPLLADRERLAGLGRAGREWVFTTLSPEAVRRSYAAMYQGVISSRRGSSDDAPA